VVFSTDTLLAGNGITSKVVQTPGEIEITPSHTQNLIESIWNSFKQTFESTTSSFASSVKKSLAASHEDDSAALHSKRQREEMVNRRTMLFEQSVSDHYTQLVLQSIPAAAHSNDLHYDNNSKRQEQQHPRHQKRWPVETMSEIGPPTSNQPRGQRPGALRWQQADPMDENSLCYCFAESSESFWSFQWCPHHEIFQGRLDKSTGIMQRYHSLGKYNNDVKNDPSQSVVKETRFLYPEALAIDLYGDGDGCGGRSEKNRMAVVVVHDLATSDNCPYQDITEEDEFTDLTIETVDEILTCQYIIHVCKVSQDDGSFANAAITPSMWWDVSPMSVSEATQLNRTILAAQHIMDLYKRETHADAHLKSSADVLTSLSSGFPPMPQSRIRTNSQLIKDMFMHAYDSYMYNGYPASEVKPLTCKPATFDLVKIPGLTLIDSLDTLIILSNYTEFARAVERLRYLNDHMTEETGLFNGGGLFSINQNVSVFETNIRVLGGLLSAHQLAEAYLKGKVQEWDVHAQDGTILIGTAVNSCSMDHVDGSACRQYNRSGPNATSNYYKYDGFLLDLARDIGDRLLPAFKTQTGIPFGTVNLLSGVPKGETTIASLAGGGTLSLEMELLGRLTGKEKYGRAAKLAARALWMRRSPQNLFGKHICTRSGDWTEYLSGIGSNSDSFYEYLVKHHILFPEDEDFWLQFVATYSGVYKQSRLGEWYADVDMRVGAASGVFRRVFEALMAFYPGLQVLLGDLSPAARTLNSIFLVREYLGFLPERFNYGNWRVDGHGGIHLLRPEILESAYFLHRGSKGMQQHIRPGLNMTKVDSSSWQWAGDFAVHALEKLTRSQCGYAAPRDVSAGTTGAINAEKDRVRLSNEMPSYFLSETLKYLYLLFDENNAIHTDEDHDWIFSTEAHPFHYQKKSTSTLHSQKSSLQERLEIRIKNERSPKKKQWEVLRNEKWTYASDEKSFRKQLDRMQEATSQIYEDRKVEDGDTSTETSYPPHLVEPIVPQEMFSGAFDVFNERRRNANPAYLSLRPLGKGADLTMSCSNVYQSELLWITALNGGITDYAQVYMSRVQDDVTVPTLRIAFLGPLNALALHGTGVHISSMYDATSMCPVRVNNYLDGGKLSGSTGDQSTQTTYGSSRFDLPGVGSFEVSAFAEGSGFLIQNVESGETIVTSLLSDGNANPESFALVYNSETSGPSSHRSVVIADLHGNAFSCVVELVVRHLAMDEEPVCFGGDEGIEDDHIVESNSRIVAQYPCAPALFGPTHLSNLKSLGAISVEAALQAPMIGEEYGCSNQEKNTHDVSEPATGDPLFSSPEPKAFSQEELHDRHVCKNNVISLVHRGICTFQEKSMNQKTTFNAKGVVVINAEDDELFVMSAGGANHHNPSDFPFTVLVTGSDGQAMLDTIESFEAEQNDNGQLFARISLVPDDASLLQTESGLDISQNKFWPVVIGGPDAIQIFSRSGWGVHATQRQRLEKPGEVEWQLLLMTHEVANDNE
jgi:ER degradation enhancer, mannosidase alpha-like 2